MELITSRRYAECGESSLRLSVYPSVTLRQRDWSQVGNLQQEAKLSIA